DDEPHGEDPGPDGPGGTQAGGEAVESHSVGDDMHAPPGGGEALQVGGQLRGDRQQGRGRGEGPLGDATRRAPSRPTRPRCSACSSSKGAFTSSSRGTPTPAAYSMPAWPHSE